MRHELSKFQFNNANFTLWLTAGLSATVFIFETGKKHRTSGCHIIDHLTLNNVKSCIF